MQQDPFSVMEDNQFYMHLFSDASDPYFPDNVPYEFTCMLPETITLQGRWFCALTEIEYTRKSSNAETPLHLAVYTDICRASITGNEKCTLLRYVPATKRKGQRIYYTPGSVNYIMVNKHDIDRIRIWIKCPGSTPEAVFDAKPCRVSLHFCKGPPVVL